MSCLLVEIHKDGVHSYLVQRRGNQLRMGVFRILGCLPEPLIKSICVSPDRADPPEEMHILSAMADTRRLTGTGRLNTILDARAC